MCAYMQTCLYVYTLVSAVYLFALMCFCDPL